MLQRIGPVGEINAGLVQANRPAIDAEPLAEMPVELRAGIWGQDVHGGDPRQSACGQRCSLMVHTDGDLGVGREHGDRHVPFWVENDRSNPCASFHADGWDRLDRQWHRAPHRVTRLFQDLPHKPWRCQRDAVFRSRLTVEVDPVRSTEIGPIEGSGRGGPHSACLGILAQAHAEDLAELGITASDVHPLAVEHGRTSNGQVLGLDPL